MAGLLSGLEAFGLSNLDDIEVYEKEKQKKFVLVCEKDVL